MDNGRNGRWNETDNNSQKRQGQPKDINEDESRYQMMYDKIIKGINQPNLSEELDIKLNEREIRVRRMEKKMEEEGRRRRKMEWIKKDGMKKEMKEWNEGRKEMEGMEQEGWINK